MFATWAYIDRKNAPVQLAVASGIGVNPFSGSSADHQEIVLPPTASAVKLDAAPIMTFDRRAAKTVDFSEVDQLGQRQPLSGEHGRGTIKIHGASRTGTVRGSVSSGPHLSGQAPAPPNGIDFSGARVSLTCSRPFI